VGRGRLLVRGAVAHLLGKGDPILMVNQTRKIDSIQVLRGLAALAVVGVHVKYKCELLFNRPVIDWYNIGNIGVDIFFVISGFIMAYTSIRTFETMESSVNPSSKNISGPERKNLGGAISFLIKRIQRVLPLYWFYTLCALAIFVVAPGQVNKSGGETVVFESFFLMPTTGVYLVRNGWTLTYEMFFYLLFAGIVFAFPRGGFSLLVMTMVSLVLMGVAFELEGPFFKITTSPLLLEFVIGIVIYGLYARGHCFFIPGILSVLVAIALMIFANWEIMQQTVPRVVLYGMPAGLITYGLLAIESRVRFPKFFLLLGNSSYSLYLSHAFVLAGLAAVFTKLDITRYFGTTSIGVTMVLTAIFGGLLSFWFIETPLQTAIKTWGKKPGVSAAGKC
jgi:exopolysaccharide production protein ExoZ